MRNFLCTVVATGLLFACPPKATQVQQDTYIVRTTVHNDPAANAALNAALAAKNKKTGRLNVEKLIKVREQYPESTAGQDALFYAGKEAFEIKDFMTARSTLNTLLYENPLHANATEARFKSSLAALELKQYKEAYQNLQGLIDHLPPDDRKRAEAALSIAARQLASTTIVQGEARAQDIADIKTALAAVQNASPENRAQELEKLTALIDSRVPFTAVFAVWQDLPTQHPAWPLMTFKLARIYYHLRDWQRLEETLRALSREAPGHAYATAADAMMQRLQKRNNYNGNKIGVLVPLTGKQQLLGEAVLKSIKLAMKDSKLELVIRDTQSDVNLGAQYVEELTFDHGVAAIIGPVSSDDTRRAALVAEELQGPLITLSFAEAITATGPHIFRNMVTRRQEVEALVKYATEKLGYKTFAVLYPNKSAGVDYVNAFWDSVESHGGSILGAESYREDQMDFRTEAKKLVGRYYLDDRADFGSVVREAKENAKDTAMGRRKALEQARSNIEPIIDFEALLIPDDWTRVGLVAPAVKAEEIITYGCDKKELEKTVKTTKRKDPKTVTLLGPSTWSSEIDSNGFSELQRRDNAVNCSIYVGSFNPLSARAPTKRFVNDFKDEYPNDGAPTVLHAHAYDTGKILKYLLEKHKPQSREEVTMRLSTLKNFDGATGKISFDDNREAQKPLPLLFIDSKGTHELATEPGAKGYSPNG